MLDEFIPNPRFPAVSSKRELKELEKEGERRSEERAKRGERKSFEEFGTKYFSDPAGFAREAFFYAEGEGPTDYQLEILDAVPKRKRIAVVSGHGSGKSWTCATAILWMALTREAMQVDWKCVVTASVGTQLFRYLWPEVRSRARDLNWNLVGRPPFNLRNELLLYSLQLQWGSAFCVAPEEPQKLEGAHSPNLAYVIDESKAVPDPIWDSVEGAFANAGADTTSEAFALAISTPGGQNGRFWDIFSRKPGYEGWWCRKITAEEGVAAGRISAEWIEEKKKQWGVESAVYRSKILAEFCAEDDSALIPLEWVTAAMREEVGESPAGS